MLYVQRRKGPCGAETTHGAIVHHAGYGRTGVFRVAVSIAEMPTRLANGYRADTFGDLAHVEAPASVARRTRPSSRPGHRP